MQAGGPIRFDIWLTEGFVLTEYAAITDVLRTTNRCLPEPVFTWRSLSEAGGPVRCM